MDTGSGKAHRLAVFQDKLPKELKWSPDGRGIFVNYSPRGPNSQLGQIGFLPSTGEGFQPITRDTNGYATLTVSADGRTLASVQQKTTRDVYLVPGAGNQSAQLSPLSSQVQDIRWLNWTADGNLLASDGARLWRMGPDGKNATQLLADPNANITRVTLCGGQYLIFTWRFHEGTNSRNIWRANADGSNAVRLTSGEDVSPVVIVRSPRPIASLGVQGEAGAVGTPPPLVNAPKLRLGSEGELQQFATVIPLCDSLLL